jgi:adenylate cyclase
VVQGDDLMGDGVNIAARIEGIADPGGIAMSRAVYEQVRDRLATSFDDRGEVELKNISRPVHIFAIGGEKTAPTPALALPDKPSIAVLPFQNMSGDPQQEYFVDGICEDVTTELSRFSSLFVIARNSAFTYKGQAVDVRRAARELGVRYVLEGSGRMSGKRARINAQLIDAVSGVHFWAERYDIVVEDVFDVQDDITRRIVATVAPKVEAAEVSKVRRARPTHFGAYGLALRAWADATRAYQRADVALRNQSIAQAEEAIRLDAGCGRAWSTLAFAYWQHANFRTAVDSAVAIERAIQAGGKALEIEPDDYMARVYKGCALWIAQRFDEALEELREAWRTNGNDVGTLIALGWGEVASGDTTTGAKRLREALRLSPRDPQQYNVYTCLCAAGFVDANYAAGVEWGELGKRQQPNYPPIHHYLALNYAGLGDLVRAGAEIEALRRVAPEWLEQRLAGFSALVRRADRERSLDLLHRAANLR